MIGQKDLISVKALLKLETFPKPITLKITKIYIYLLIFVLFSKNKHKYLPVTRVLKEAYGKSKQ